jgi:hypothetical protein
MNVRVKMVSPTQRRAWTADKQRVGIQRVRVAIQQRKVVDITAIQPNMEGLTRNLPSIFLARILTSSVSFEDD